MMPDAMPNTNADARRTCSAPLGACARHTDPVAAPEPQPILSVPTESAIFLVLTVARAPSRNVADFLADVSGLKRSVGFRFRRRN